MPHIVLEYSANLSENVKSSGVLKKLHQTVVDSGLFTPDAVKARSIPYADYVLHGDATRFAHVTVSILSGRTEEQRGTLNDAVFAVLKGALPDGQKLSSNIHEMNVTTYRK